MKTETILAALVLAASAAAIPEAAPEPKHKHAHGWTSWCVVPGYYCPVRRDLSHVPTTEEVAACGSPGNPCHRMKHAAHGIADVMNAADKYGDHEQPSYCSIDGAPCHKASGHIGKIAEKAREHYSHVWAREADAVAEAEPKKAKGWTSWCVVPGYYCPVRRDADAHRERIGCKDGQFCPTGDFKHDQEAHAAYRGRLGVTGEPGTPWLVARDADASPKHKHAHGWTSWCVVPGYYCPVRRSTGEPNPHREGICGLDGECAIGRDALEMVRKHPEMKAELKGCGPEGTPCLVIKNKPGHVARDAEPKKAKGWTSWCVVPGYYCPVRRSTNEPQHFCPPGAPCLSGKDAQTLASIIKANDPDFLKKECNKPGNDCHTLKEIQKVVKLIKSAHNTSNEEEEAIKRCEDGGARCSVLALKHAHDKQQGVAGAVQGEKDCHAGNGFCGAVRRDLEELESLVNAAVADVDQE